jgi:hypothetical protein
MSGSIPARRAGDAEERCSGVWTGSKFEFHCPAERVALDVPAKQFIQDVFVDYLFTRFVPFSTRLKMAQTV